MRIEDINSFNNSTWKKLKILTNHRQRKKEGLFLLEGLRIIKEALKSNCPLKMILFSSYLGDNLKEEILPLLIEKKARIINLADDLFNQLALTDNPQGILAVASLPVFNQENFYLRKLNNYSSVVVVDGIQDPGNLGGIIRSADALGAGGILHLKGSVDVYNPKTLRASMGSVFRLPIWTEMEKEELFSFLEEQNMNLVMGVPREGIPVYEVDFKRKVALLVGNEANGPSAELLNFSSKTLAYIPMPGGTESLNVAIACSVLLYEMCRQRSV